MFNKCQGCKPDTNPNQLFLKSKKPRPIENEKMCWLVDLDVKGIPWSPSNPKNDLGLPRHIPATKWREWNIEFPGDLFSLWGTIHLLDERFDEAHRGQQYLAGCVISCVMSQTCGFAAWTPGFIDRIVFTADKYYDKLLNTVGNKPNYEIRLEDFQGVEGVINPFSFNLKFENVIFGFVYSDSLPDRFNLSQALSFFFKKHVIGILICPVKNLAFGKIESSYFMFDCQSYGPPLYNTAAYMLKCESLNRLIYCMTVTLNVRCHNHQFNLYSVTVDLHEIPSPQASEIKKGAKVPSKTSENQNESTGERDRKSSKVADVLKKEFFKTSKELDEL